MAVLVTIIKERFGVVMAIVITNGTYYIRYTNIGATKKTSNINNAYQFSSVDEAIKGMKKAKEN